MELVKSDPKRIWVGEASPYGAISLIVPYVPHGTIREIRPYPLCGGKSPATPRDSVSTDREPVILLRG